MIKMANNSQTLRKRLIRLIRDNNRTDGWELAMEIVPKLQSVGRLILIGGAVRDVARCGGVQFRSDLDFVIHDTNRDRFVKLVRELGGRRNRYGGFALDFVRWKVDVWSIEDTWAHTAGLVQVREPADLLKCTFFDWDAILFDLESEAIVAEENYFQLLAANVLDINLEENPNPRGSLVRALRRGALWKVRFGERLTNFVREQIRKETWDTLVALDDAAFSQGVLRYYDADSLRQNLEYEKFHQGVMVTEPFGPPDEQLELGYPR